MRRYGRAYGRSGGMLTRLFLKLTFAVFALVGLVCLVTHQAPMTAIPEAVAGVQHFIATFHQH